ncbi:MAG: hypothetical protein V4627_03680 [Pseudomonadota bacterium]
MQVALWTGAYLALGYWTDKWTVLFVSPLYGALIARPLINLMASLRQLMRSSVWMPAQGQHYVFKGTTVHVLQDEDGWRWVRLADVQLVLETPLNTRVLAVTYPERLQRMGRPAQMHMRDDALLMHLGKQNNDAALRLRTWVERNVAFPAQRMRERADQDQS